MAFQAQYVGPENSIDVTRMVAQWAAQGLGEKNMGFVLRGPEENLNAFTEEACLTGYLPQSFALEVQYQ